jgi:hypothetical protein
MSLTISGVLFTGPFALGETIIRRNQHPCVYAVVSKGGPPWDPEFRLVACDETGDDGHNFATDPRAAVWRQAGSEVSLYLFIVPRDDDPDGAQRRALARRIAADHVPPRDLIGKR